MQNNLAAFYKNNTKVTDQVLYHSIYGCMSNQKLQGMHVLSYNEASVVGNVFPLATFINYVTNSPAPTQVSGGLAATMLQTLMSLRPSA